MGTFIDVLNSNGYLFYLYDTTNTARFILHLEELTADFNAVDTVYLAINNGEYIPTNNSTNATQYLWNFGDNNTSTSLNPVHHYTQPGLYNVTLDAIGMQSCTDSKTQQVEVISAVVTSLEKLSSSEFNVYPNPIKKGNQLNFEIKKSQKYYIEIMDCVGKNSFMSSIKENESSLRIPDKFKSGIYILTIYDDSKNIINMRKISIIN
jgi:PKD repeat protein